jgi:hypothetical protein
MWISKNLGVRKADGYIRNMMGSSLQLLITWRTSCVIKGGDVLVQLSDC